MAVLSVERAEGYAIVTLNRPDARNALSRVLRHSICNTLRALSEDPGVQVLVITGAGEAFCAGLDLAELGGSGAALQEILAETSPVDALKQFSGPVIGAINGAAVTGGFELALGCDVLIASERARFADTHGRVGLLPIWGLSQKLSRAVGISRAKEMSLTGNFIDARMACDWGLVNRVVPHGELLVQACAMARDMLTLAPGLLIAYKKLIDDGFAEGFGQALATEQLQARTANVGANGEVIEQHRQAVLARGREQTGGRAQARTVHLNEAAREYDSHNFIAPPT
jgi:enoyl-CoA hydratase